MVLMNLLEIFRKAYTYSCMLSVGLIITSNGQSISTLVLIALERYMAICHPIKHRARFTAGPLTAAILTSWLVWLSVGLGPLFKETLHSPNVQYLGCYLLLYYDKWYLFSLAMVFFLATGFITFCHVQIIKAVRRQHKVQPTNTANKTIIHSRDIKVIKKLVIVPVLFFLCWIAYKTMILIWSLCPHEDEYHGFVRRCGIWEKILIWPIMLAVLNSLMNFFIYAFSFKEFQDAFASMFCCCCCRERFTPNVTVTGLRTATDTNT